MQHHFEHILLLKKVPFFELLRTDQLHHVARVLVPVAWSKGEYVFEKGDPSDSMFFIMAGRVGIALDNTASAGPFISELAHGECFGEMGILDDLPRSATAHVIENTQALALSKEKLRGIILSYPELGLGMLNALSRRIRKLNDMIVRVP